MVEDADRPIAVSPRQPAQLRAAAGNAPRRVVAIGDVHADLDAFQTALQLAGVVDVDMQWVGGNAVVVQVGDQLDRGTDEAAVLNLTHSLQAQARRAGGAPQRMHALMPHSRDWYR